MSPTLYVALIWSVAGIYWSCFYSGQPLMLHFMLWLMMVLQMVSQLWIDYRLSKADRVLCEHPNIEVEMITQHDQDGKLSGLQCMSLQCPDCGWRPVIHRGKGVIKDGRKSE